MAPVLAGTCYHFAGIALILITKPISILYFREGMQYDLAILLNTVVVDDCQRYESRPDTSLEREQRQGYVHQIDCR